MNIGIIKEYSPLHSHKCFEIVVFTQGSGFFIADNQRIPFSPGTVVIVPPEILHETFSEDSALERIYINEISNFIPSITAPVVVNDDAEGENLFFAKMIYRNRYHNSEYVSSLVNSFIHHILQDIKIVNELNTSIKTIVGEITDNFSDSNININSILRQSGYAEDYIRSQFKKVTGKTPIGFLTEVRVSHACFLMDIYKDSLSLSEIAEKCGYTDYIYFSRRFKEIKGVSPRKYMYTD